MCVCVCGGGVLIRVILQVQFSHRPSSDGHVGKSNWGIACVCMMFIHIQMYMYIYLYLYIYIYIRVDMHVNLYICIYIYTCIHRV